MENVRHEAVVVIFIILTLSHLEDVESRNTFQCPTSCLCISGNTGAGQICNILQEQVTSDAWSRFQNISTVESMVIYLCRNEELNLVDQEMTSSADVLFLDGNIIESLDIMDSIDNATLDNVTYPTKMLSLSNNKITKITTPFLHRLPHLKLFFLRNNLLDNLRWTKGEPSIFPELLELDMSRNTLTILMPEDIGTFPLLIRLDLSGNEINFVDGKALLKFPRLEYLDLSSNQITQQSFHTDHTPIASIKVLSLSDNAIGNIAESGKVFSALPSLTSLDLSGNSITSKTISFEAFSAFQELQNLNLSSCNIEYLSAGWLNGGPNATLKVLDLSRNLLTSISAKYLSTLNLNKRDFKEQNLKSLLVIEVLYLNDNDLLSTIEKDAFGYVPNIELLFVQNCNIQRFTVATPENEHQPISSSLPALRSIWIFGNPVACDCHLRPLILWSGLTIQTTPNRTQTTNEIDPSYYTVDPADDVVTVEVGIALCSSPEKYSGMAVEALPIEDMTCVEETYSMVIALLIGPLSFAGAVILVILCGSLHVLATKMRHNAMTIYYPKPEPSRNNNRMQKWHDPPAHCPTRSPWHGDATSTSIGQHGGLYTNLVMGQIASRGRYGDARVDRKSSISSRASYEPRTRQAKTRSTHFAEDASSQRRESDGPDGGSKFVSSDIEMKSQDARRRFSSKDDSSSLHKSHVDSRTDDSQL